MYTYVMWLPMDGKLFKLIGIAPIEYKPQLDAAASSLRVLSPEEKKSFKITLMRVVEARKGENIRTLSARVGNVLNEELTAIINSKNAEDTFEIGELVKVVLTYPYLSD